MAVAKTVLEVEPRSLDWLRIEDEDGNVWQYVRKRNLAEEVPADVEVEYTGGSQIRAVLVRDVAGVAVLRQDDPGLPLAIVVDYVSPSPGSALAPTPAFWKGKVEYEQVEPRLL